MELWAIKPICFKHKTLNYLKKEIAPYEYKDNKGYHVSRICFYVLLMCWCFFRRDTYSLQATIYTDYFSTLETFLYCGLYGCLANWVFRAARQQTGQLRLLRQHSMVFQSGFT